MLLDSSFLIDLEEELAAGRPGPAMSFAARHRRAVPRISVISIGELAAGEASEADLRAFLARYRVVAIRPEIGYLAGRLERSLAAKGQRLGENDNWIAATALYYGEPLVTSDRDFERVPPAVWPLRIMSY